MLSFFLPGQQSTRLAGTVQLLVVGIEGSGDAGCGRCCPASCAADVAVPPKRLVDEASTLPEESHNSKAPEAWSTNTAPKEDCIPVKLP